MTVFRKGRLLTAAVLTGCCTLMSSGDPAEAALGHVRRTSRRTARRTTARRTVPVAPVTRGVARRTTRRTVRRTGRRIYALPVGCPTVVVGGATYYVVGKVHYEAVIVSGKTVYYEVKL